MPAIIEMTLLLGLKLTVAVEIAQGSAKECIPVYKRLSLQRPVLAQLGCCKPSVDDRIENLGATLPVQALLSVTSDTMHQKQPPQLCKQILGFTKSLGRVKAMNTN